MMRSTWPLSFMKRRSAGNSSTSTLTIASGKVSADVSNYPVHVRMSDLGSSFWSAVASDGSNIRVRQGGADLPFDLAYFNYAGQSGSLFFKANLLAASNNVFTIEVVAGATAPAVTDPIGRNAVWSAFHRVVHGGGLVDRTGSGITITQVGTVTVSGGKFTFATNSALYMSTSQQTGNYSMFFYGFANGFSIKNYAFLSFSDSWSASPNRQTMAFRSNTENLAVWNNTDSWSSEYNTEDPITFTAGISIITGSQRRLHAQGLTPLNSASSANIPSGANPVWIIGAEDSSLSEEYENDMYLALLALSTLPDVFFTAMDANLRTPTSFYSIT